MKQDWYNGESYLFPVGNPLAKQLEDQQVDYELKSPGIYIE
jgi:hypothetical protein